MKTTTTITPKTKVHILATCRNLDLLPYTLLVFDSIRIGFPTAEIVVTGNGLVGEALGAVIGSCAATNCSFSNEQATIHHKWIERLAETETEPFVICDTDVIFFRSVEDWKFDTALAGFRIPEFVDEFTGAITRSRLHTSLMFISPKLAKSEVEKIDSTINPTPFNPPANLIYPLCLPLNGRMYFHDTMSLMYHAIGGTEFDAHQKDAIFHFNFGTLSDMVLPRLKNGAEIGAARDAILKNHDLGRGAWRWQEAHYTSRRPVFDGGNVIKPVTPEEAAKAREWNAELCRGNEEAMNFGDLWYGYVHGIDDLIDSMKDGRPMMSREQIISLFFAAAILYNHPFFLKHRHLLFPIILETTNLYKLSATWEDSPQPHLRLIADVLRSCGLKMHTTIALICGGEAHQFDMTKRMYEYDFLHQHDKHGNPI